MQSRAITRTLPTLRQSTSIRAFSTSIRTMAEGDTGAGGSKGGYGGAQKDAFTTREKANEDAYVRQQEITKQRLRDARQNVTDLGNDLDKQLADLEKDGNKGNK